MDERRGGGQRRSLGQEVSRAHTHTHIAARMTFCGLLPTRDMTARAICLAMKCLVMAAAMVKPPSSSMMVWGRGRGRDSSMRVKPPSNSMSMRMMVRRWGAEERGHESAGLRGEGRGEEAWSGAAQQQFPLDRRLHPAVPFSQHPPPTTDLGEHGVEDGGCCLLSLHPHRRVMGTVHLGEEVRGEGGRG